MGTDGNASKQPGMNGYFLDPNKKNPKELLQSINLYPKYKKYT